VAVLGVLLSVRTPRYRVTEQKVRELLEQVLCAQASANDWQVFIGYQIRDNPKLEAIRRACQELDETQYRSQLPGGFLLTSAGLTAVAELLDDLNQQPSEK
jgi:hypothetical protein